jgi:hypothetical protein
VIEQILERAAMLVKLAILSSVLVLSACAVPTTGVVPRGEDMYTVTRQGSGAWVTVDSLKAEALQEADAFCVTKKMKLKFIHSKEIPAGPLGRWPESEVLFRCE